jgi:RNA polymerase sigma factor (sigma-70 family)
LKQINWDELFRKNAAQLKGICRRYVGDIDVAEDLVQETFITAIDKVSGYKATGSLEGWIRKIAVNKSLMYIREKQLNHVPADVLANQVEQETEMENVHNTIRGAIEKASFNSGELLSVIDCLPVNHKVVFNLYVLDGYSHNQIAKMMSISPNTSKSHLLRARKKAQELLYQKAIQKQPKEKYHRSTFLLLLFQPNYIDRLFRRELKGFQLSTNSPGIGVSSAPATTIKWGATLAGKITTCGIIITSITAGYFIYNSFGKPVLPAPNAEPACIVVPADTLKAEPEDFFNKITPKTTDSIAVKPHKKKPVIIRKTIVKHDTIRLEKPSSK